MDFYALFRIIQKHPRYKTDGDSFRQQILLSRHQGTICWKLLSLRMKEYFPDIYHFLESNRELYKMFVAANKEIKKQGFSFIVFGEDLYPKSFYLTQDPPLSFTYLGQPHWQQQHSIAVVGSREPRSESLIWMEQELSIFAEAQRVPIVSGGARGGYKRSGILAKDSNESLDAVVTGSCGTGSLHQTIIKLGREWHGTGYMNSPVSISSLLPQDCQSVPGQSLSVAFSDGKGHWDSVYGQNYNISVSQLWSGFTYNTKEFGPDVGLEAWNIIVKSMR
jgi:hypothetical protein